MKDKKVLKDESIGWDNLNALGKRYYELVQEGYGTTLENRCEEQIKIINEFILGSYPFLIKVANDLLGGICKIKTKYGSNYISLEWVKKISNIPSSPTDLANEAVIGIIKSLKRYNPEKGAVSTFLNLKAITIMYQYCIKAHRGEHNIVKELVDIFYNFKKTSKEENLEDQLDEVISENKIITILDSELSEREKYVIYKNYGFLGEKGISMKKIGDELEISREAVRQIREKVFKKLRNSCEIENLRKFL